MKKYPIQMTTSQFAKMHNLNKRTLHYYDQIGLFSPAYKGENHYRYYDYSQSIELENILMLKELNMSIEEIKDYLHSPNEELFLNIADQKLKEIDASIQKLERTKEILQHKQQQLILSQQIQDRYIELVDCEEMYMMVTTYEFLELHMPDILEHFKQVDNEYKVGCGSFVSVEKIKQNNLSVYDGLFTPVDEYQNQAMIRPKGKYIRAYIKGNWNRIEDFYKDILVYASNNHLELEGYAYEIGLNEFAIDKIDDYVTEIMILTKEK